MDWKEKSSSDLIAEQQASSDIHSGGSHEHASGMALGMKGVYIIYFIYIIQYTLEPKVKRSNRPKKPVQVEDLGYVEKDSKARARISGVNTETVRRCERMLQSLKKHPCAEPFLEAVDPIKLKAPDYLEIVKCPMDLSTVERRLKAGEYKETYALGMDIRLIWRNSWLYNARDSHIYMMTMEISSYFEKIFKELDNLALSLEAPESFGAGAGGQTQVRGRKDMEDMQKNLEKVRKEVKELSKGLARGDTQGGAPGSESLPLSRGHSKAGGGMGMSKNMDKPMSLQEKTLLSTNIRKLNADKLRGIITIISDTIDMNKNKEVLEFDIENLPTRKCRELEQYVKRALNTKSLQTKKKKGSKPQGRGGMPTQSAQYMMHGGNNSNNGNNMGMHNSQNTPPKMNSNEVIYTI